jgi:hypothetical protein
MIGRAAGRLSAMELDERGRQLDEVPRQLCEVGSVGHASAARLYAATNAATAERERESRRSANRGPPLGSPTEGRRPDRYLLIAVSGSQLAELSKMLARQNPAHGFSGEPRSTVRDPRTAPAHPAKSLRPAQAICAARRQHHGGRERGGNGPGVDRQRSTSAARRQPAGSAARRQHHGPGAWGRS